MLTEILQKAMLLVMGLVFAISALVVFLRAKNVGIANRKAILKSAGYLNAWVLLLCFVLTIVFACVHHFEAKKTVSAVISLNYSEASGALNSNGTRYNMNEIISDEVVARAIEKGALKNVTVKQLKSCLTVAPCVQGGVDSEADYHISTEFSVGYRASKHTRHLDSENVIQLIASAYKDYYIEQYTDRFTLGDEDIDFDSMEYMDALRFLEKESTAVLNYLYSMVQKNPSFVTENGSTFQAIAGKLSQFQKTQINENLRSYLLQNGLVKDKQAYVGRLLYQNKNTDFDRQKNQASYLLCNDAIAMYSEEMTRIVLVPTWDESGKYYMGRTKVGIDELSVMATTFSDYVASYEKNMSENDLIIGKIESGSGTEENYAEADELIDFIYETIKEYEKEAIRAGREYSRHKMNQCVALSIYGVSLMSQLKTVAFFAVVAYAAIMLCRIAKKFPKKA